MQFTSNLGSHPELMIGVATAQNTVNTVPAIQLGIKRFQFIETAVAKNNGWANNAKTALLHKGIEVLEPISLPELIEPDFLQIEKYLLSLKDSLEPILWNIGGGQKNHSLGVWEVFKKRKNLLDQVCYSNTQAQVIEIWKWKEDQVIHDRIPLDFEDDLANYLAVYGFEIKPEGEGTLLYENGKVVNAKDSFDWFQFEDFRRYLSLTFQKVEIAESFNFTLEEIRNILHPDHNQLGQKIAKDIMEKNPVLQRPGGHLLKPNFLQFNILNQVLSYLKTKVFIQEKLVAKEYQFTDSILISKLQEKGISSKVKMSQEEVVNILSMNSGFFFEEVLISELQKALSMKKHLVKKAYANVKIKSKDNEAEFDLLLLTSLGTLHVLDGKLDAFDKKDENSRKLVLSKAGGAFSSFQPVFSFYPKDLNGDFISAGLLQKFKTYHAERANFMVYNSFKPETVDIEINDHKVSLNHFKDLLNHLNLLKN